MILAKLPEFDQGREMTMHKELSKRTCIAVYFCDPLSPSQRGSNENMNGAWCTSTCPRAQTSAFTARINLTLLQIKSIAGPERDSEYDLPWLSIENY